jgi:hypothetical protein
MTESSLQDRFASAYPEAMKLINRLDTPTVFPLHTIVANADGVPACACGATCTDLGKHPAASWGSLEAVDCLLQPDGRGHGLATGERSGVIVVDLDVKDGKDGIAEWARLGGGPETFTVATGGGGLQLYFRWPGFRVRNSQSEVAPGLDIRGDGGFVVMPGSPHRSGKHYEVASDVPIAGVPQWLLAHPALRAPEITATDVSAAAPNTDIPREERIAAAKALLENEPPAISGQGGHPVAMRVIGKVVRHCVLVTEEEALEALATWNARCQPPWSDGELRHKIRDAIVNSPIMWGLTTLALREWWARVRVEGFRSIPAIEVTHNLWDATNNAADALAAADDIFQRAGHLVRIVRVAESETERENLVAGTPTIWPLPQPLLTAKLTQLAHWYRRRKDELVPTTPPETVVGALMSLGSWPKTPMLTGVTESPVLRRDGSLLQEPGYDSQTSYFYEPSIEFPRVPEEPTQEDAAKALQRLLEPFRDFPFKTDEDRYVSVAAILTVLARPAIDGPTPMFTHDASTRGSGKTLLTDVEATIATGRPAARATYPRGDEELEKILGGYVLVHRALDSDSGQIKSTKSKRARRVPIEPTLMPLLQAMRHEADGEGLVVEMPPMCEWAAKLRAHLQLAGVRRADLFANDATRRPITMHCLRATGLTWRAVRGDPPFDIKDGAGHTDLETTQRYVVEARSFTEDFGTPFPTLPSAIVPESSPGQIKRAEVPTN